MYPEGKIQQKNLFEYWKYINIFSTLCPHIPLQVKILTGIKSRSVKGKYVYVVLFTQPETDTTKNVVLSKMVLMQLVPLVYRCSDLDKAHSSISGWWNSAFTTFTVSLWTLFVYGSKKRPKHLVHFPLPWESSIFKERKDEGSHRTSNSYTASLPPAHLESFPTKSLWHWFSGFIFLIKLGK